MASHNNASAAGSHYFDDERFHQSFTLPPNASRPGEFKVTYADFGHRNDERVLLFCGPLVGSRFVLATKDEVAKQHGVRIVSADRPGFGGTPDVPPADRVGVWLEIVEALLQHLGVRHVAVLGYSGGAIYAMNVLLRLRHLLHPTRPYVALCAPWVHPSHSGVSTLKVAGLLPNGLVGSFDRVLQLVSNIGPAFQFSSVLSGFVPSLSRGPSSVAPGVDPDTVAREESASPALLQRITSESVQGVGQDVLMLLKRDEYPGCWGSWGDYDTLVPLLAQAERERRAVDSSIVLPLRVRVFFAESDNIIGTAAAPSWLDNCWRSEQCGQDINYSSATIPKTTHDTLLDLRYGVSQQIFEDIAN
ncbi:Alpha/Beta hydrolase protein [Nemania sp. FL0031]|nr:Alpha/Beta hydrolase protein [Nemania sp. FL0031]